MPPLRYLLSILLLLTPFASGAQVYFSRQSTPEAFRILTLRQTPASFDILLNRYSDSQLRLPTSFYRSGFTTYRNYIDRSTDYPDLDTNRARTNLHLLLGTKRDQLLFADHHQRLGRGFTGGLHYHSIVSPGFLRNQLAKNKGFGIFLALTRNRYQGKLSFDEAKVNSNENGGIIDTVFANIPSRSDLEIIPVNLSGASAIQRRQVLEFTQSLRITDSVRPLSVSLDGALVREGRSYRETAPVSLLYPEPADTLATYDTAFFNNLRISPAVHYQPFRDSSFSLHLRAGMRYGHAEERTGNRYRDRQWQELTYGAELGIREHQLLFSAIQAGGDAFSGNYHFRAEYFQSSKRRYISSLHGGAEMIRAAAAMTDHYYASNHFNWNYDFSAEDITRLFVRSEMVKDHLTIQYSHTTWADKIIYNGEGLPYQLSSSRSLGEMKLDAFTEAGKFSLLAYGVYRPEVVSEYALPEHEVYGRISWRNKFFRQALHAEFGVSGFVTAAYKSPWFDPATGRYRISRTEKVGGTPVVNAFVNLRIKTALIAVQVENLGYGWLGDPHYTGPRNPAPSRLLRLSVFWQLRN